MNNRLKAHISTRYAQNVLNGTIVACRWVKKACERHLNDLENVASGARKDIYFDLNAADRRLDFYQFCHHYKGEWAGEVIKPAPWQAFIKSCVFGWKRTSDDTRRFRTVYIQVARKNGKSTDEATDGLYLLVADGEPGAEIYTAATKKQQAAIVHCASAEMVKSSPSLKKLVGISRLGKNIFNLHVEKTASKYEPLGQDSDTEDGLNVQAAIVDEVHAHKTRGMWDVLESATGSRRQPLLIGITTAGFNQNGIGYELYDYSRKILAGTVEDDSFFAIIYTIDLKSDWPDLRSSDEDGDGPLEDNWQDESIWIKANPNLGVSVKLDDLRRKAKKAAVIPASQNNFLTKHLDVWTQQQNRWISLTVWDSNNTRDVTAEKMAGRDGVGAIDLSAVKDLTAWVMAFPDPEDTDRIDILMRVWCPEARLYDRENRYRDQYQAWKKEGYLYTTEGEAIDYDYVRSQVIMDLDRYKISTIACDYLFQGYEFAQKLNKLMHGTDDDPKVLPCRMGYLTMGPLCQEFERRLLGRKLNHGGNPILRFMADNVMVSMDPAGNLKPNKAVSQGRIDGIVGILMDIFQLMQQRPKPKIIIPKAI